MCQTQHPSSLDDDEDTSLSAEEEQAIDREETNV